MWNFEGRHFNTSQTINHTAIQPVYYNTHEYISAHKLFLNQIIQPCMQIRSWNGALMWFDCPSVGKLSNQQIGMKRIDKMCI